MDTTDEEHLRATTKSPLDQALAARNRAGQSPVPDYHAARERRARTVEPPPPDFDPRAVKGDGISAEAARHALGNLHSTWSIIVDAAASDESLPALAKVAQGALTQGLSSVDRSLEAIERDAKAQEARIGAATQAAISPNIATEIRAEIAKMARARPSQMDQIVSLVRDDARVASAALSAPAFLSGLTQEQFALVQTTAGASHAPDAVAALDVALKARAKLTAARDRSLTTLGPKLALWQNPESTRLGKLREIARGN